MSWPRGQALPRFATPSRLDLLDLSGALEPDALLAVTAQGVVNRNRPRVWLLRDADEGKRTWLDTVALPGTPVTGAEQLVTSYRREIRGAVLADAAVPATRNVATTLAGLENAVVAEPAVAERLGLPIVADLRGRFTDDRAEANDRALLEQLMADMPNNSPYLGWWPADVTGESEGTELASRHGLYVVASDFSLNLTVLGGIRATGRAVRSAPAPPLEDRTYVTFTMTDGDNIQYCQHRMRQIWDTPQRGLAPLNWTISPLLRDAAPPILAYYQDTATPNDLLVAGTRHPRRTGVSVVRALPAGHGCGECLTAPGLGPRS